MMLKLYIKDNTNGEIHEYGTNKHDALIIQNDGSLHYENLQNVTGTMFPEEGYSFCLDDGRIPDPEDVYGDAYLDIGGEYYNATDNAEPVKHGKWERRGNKATCSCCKFIYYSNHDDFNYCPNCGAKMDAGSN